MKPIEYWTECLSCACDDAGITLSPEQLKALAEAVQSGHENYGQAYYQPENPLAYELKETQRQLKIEREKVSCAPCNGKGRIETQGPYHSSNSQCWKCHGEGKHNP